MNKKIAPTMILSALVWLFVLSLGLTNENSGNESGTYFKQFWCIISGEVDVNNPLWKAILILPVTMLITLTILIILHLTENSKYKKSLIIISWIFALGSIIQSLLMTKLIKEELDPFIHLSLACIIVPLLAILIAIALTKYNIETNTNESSSQTN